MGSIKRKDIWEKENMVNEAYVQSIELANKLHEEISLIQEKICELVKLDAAAECDNPDLGSQRKTLIAYMTKEAEELEKSLDSYQNETY